MKSKTRPAIDPEEAMQEREDLFSTCVLALFTYAPVFLYGLMQLFVFGLTLAIIVEYFTR